MQSQRLITCSYSRCCPVFVTAIPSDWARSNTERTDILSLQFLELLEGALQWGRASESPLVVHTLQELGEADSQTVCYLDHVDAGDVAEARLD